MDYCGVKEFRTDFKYRVYDLLEKVFVAGLLIFGTLELFLY